MHYLPFFRLLFCAVVFTLFSGSPTGAAFLKYPFKADFNVRTARYSSSGLPVFSMNIFNNSTKAYDSLQARIYFRSTDGFENDLGIRLDLCVLYRSDGYKDVIDSTLRRQLYNNIAAQKPVKLEGTYEETSQTYAYSLTLPLSEITIGSQTRIRYDIYFINLQKILINDKLIEPPQHAISDYDWSFGPHSVSTGDLIDFPGVDSVTKDAIDTEYPNLPINYYLTIQRNGDLLWGIPPNWQTVYTKETFIPTDTRAHQDPMPYALIAVPFNEYEEQLKRDSANLTISPLRVNQAGYRPGDTDYFYCVDSLATTFSVINTANHTTAASGTLKSTGTTSSGQLKIRASNSALLMSGGDTKYLLEGRQYKGPVLEGKLPDLPEGRYRIVAGADTSAPFIIRHDVYNMVKDALLKFYGVNRCGDSKSWFHPPCHIKDPVPGGWHDCGDHLKEGATMSYTAAVLGLASAAFSDVDQDIYDADQYKTGTTDGITDILYEAKHGADFILRSYDLAGGDVSKMVTSIGGFGNPGCGDDHAWWGPPELQDAMPASRGGPPRCARSEPTTDYLAKYAANLAFVSKKIMPSDASYAERCLKAAKVIYEYTKPRIDATDTPAYSGSAIVSDDAAFGCLALLFATGERKYLDELCFDTTIGVKARVGDKTLFEGGWFTNDDVVFSKTSANTDWSSTQTHVLWGFFRLILNDTTLCRQLNLTETERLTLIEKTVYNLLANLSSVGLGTDSISLPPGISWIPSILKYGRPWFTMHTQMEWVWNRYQAGNITDLFYYYDIATHLQGVALPNTPATTNWKADEVKTVIVRMMDYMLGVNPWDISMIYGIGYKNFNHPHHRAANPELKNCYADYHYRHLVGALQGGYTPTTSLYNEHADDYFHSEVGIDGTTNILMPVLGLSAINREVNRKYTAVKIVKPVHSLNIIQKRTSGSILIHSKNNLQSAALYSISGRVIDRQQATTSQPGSLRLQCRANSGMYLLKVVFTDGTTIAKKVSCIN